MKVNNATAIYLETTKHGIIGRPEFFASTQIKNNYVSFYLMPVYCFPEFLMELPLSLLKRMQGKSCFNFKSVDEGAFVELAELTRLLFGKYRAENKI